jgi:adenylyltransferase/sulfurtransferase
MPEVGGSGQRKLKEASVAIVGLGGLGSPAAYYLAAAGVGRLGLIDFDSVDESNLQRQIIHFQKDVGRSKTESAAEKLRGVNPHISLDIIEEPNSSKNA